MGGGWGNEGKPDENEKGENLTDLPFAKPKPLNSSAPAATRSRQRVALDVLKSSGNLAEPRRSSRRHNHDCDETARTHDDCPGNRRSPPRRCNHLRRRCRCSRRTPPCPRNHWTQPCRCSHRHNHDGGTSHRVHLGNRKQPCPSSRWTQRCRCNPRPPRSPGTRHHGTHGDGSREPRPRPPKPS